MRKLYIVEDDDFVREEIAEIFKDKNFQIDLVLNFKRVTDYLLSVDSGLVILDLNLPYLSGFEILRDLKKNTKHQILVLTSRDSMEDELASLDLGADEFISKPVKREILLARAEKLLKNFDIRKNLLEGDDFYLDRSNYVLYVNEQYYSLPQIQGKILEIFLDKKGELLNKDFISQKVWGTSIYIDENALQVNLSRLRKLIEKYGLNIEIESIRNKGYILKERGKE